MTSTEATMHIQRNLEMHSGTARRKSWLFTASPRL
jgi:hypothetical protein